MTPDEEEVRKSSKLLSLLLNDGIAIELPPSVRLNTHSRTECKEWIIYYYIAISNSFNSLSLNKHFGVRIIIVH